MHSPSSSSPLARLRQTEEKGEKIKRRFSNTTHSHSLTLFIFSLLPLPLPSPSFLPSLHFQGSGDDLSSWKVTVLHVYVIKEPWTKQFNDPDGMRNLVQPSDPSDPAPLVAQDAAARAALERQHSQVLRITISIFISRLSLYFALQSILPVALCTLLSLTCFFLGASRVSTRLELTFSLFLTLAAIQFVIGEELPKTSAVLPSQVLVLFSYSFLFAVAAESLVVYHVEIFPELRGEWRRRAAAREAAKRELSSAVSDSGRKLVKSLSSLGGRRTSTPMSSPFKSQSSGAAGSAAMTSAARRRSKDAAASAGGEPSSATASAPAAPSSSSPSASATQRELRPLRSIRFSSDVELGTASSSSKKMKSDDDDGFEEKGAGGPATAAAVASGDHHDGGEHHDEKQRRGPSRSLRRGGSGAGAEEDDDDDEERAPRDRGAAAYDEAERDRYAFAAWWIDRASFWLLLVGYVLAAVLIFSLSSALAPGECAQFAQQSLINECRLARRDAEARRRLGGGVVVGAG